MTSHERAACATCGHVHATYVPSGGDGSLTLMVNHRGNQLPGVWCPGSRREPAAPDPISSSPIWRRIRPRHTATEESTMTNPDQPEWAESLRTIAEAEDVIEAVKLAIALVQQPTETRPLATELTEALIDRIYDEPDQALAREKDARAARQDRLDAFEERRAALAEAVNHAKTLLADGTASVDVPALADQFHDFLTDARESTTRHRREHRHMTPAERDHAIAVAQQIKGEVGDDARRRDGQPFTGAAVGAALGEMAAQIGALATLMEMVLREYPGAQR